MWYLVLYLASIETLEEDHPHRPDVHLVGDFWWLLSHHKTLWREVPETHTRVIQCLTVHIHSFADWTLDSFCEYFIQLI